MSAPKLRPPANAPKNQKGRYPITSIPRGFRLLVAGEKIMETDLCDNSTYKHCAYWEPVGKGGAVGMVYSNYHFPMIRVGQKPAKKRASNTIKARIYYGVPGGDKMNALEGDACYFAGFSGRKVMPHACVPADAASYARMVDQVAKELAKQNGAKSAQIRYRLARAVLACIGIKEKAKK